MADANKNAMQRKPDEERTAREKAEKEMAEKERVAREQDPVPQAAGEQAD